LVLKKIKKKNSGNEKKLPEQSFNQHNFFVLFVNYLSASSMSNSLPQRMQRTHRDHRGL